LALKIIVEFSRALCYNGHTVHSFMFPLRDIRCLAEGLIMADFAKPFRSKSNLALHFSRDLRVLECWVFFKKAKKPLRTNVGNRNLAPKNAESRRQANSLATPFWALKASFLRRCSKIQKGSSNA